ncbi:MAG: AraC family transcriptional regulator [Blautia sp.]|nr:AraC family transcriptional regulator [Blautia sp.]MCM1201210.1 AraC family transcriptional regulator [Bacteroides fragilis]
MNDKNLEQYEKTGFLLEPFKLFHIKDCIRKDFPFHYHDFYKIIYFVGGNVSYKIEGKTYRLKPHDFVLVDYNAIHKPEIESDMPYERYIVYLAEEFLNHENQRGERLKRCFEMAGASGSHVVHFAPGSYEDLLGCLLRIEKEEQGMQDFLHDKMLEAFFLEFMVLFNRACLAQPKAFITTAVYHEKIVDVISYIQAHLTENISIDFLADTFYISRYYLMRQFREATGYSIHQYISEKRILEAKRRILTGVPASKVCYECGYSDYSTFARRFKEIVGVAPSMVKEMSFYLS